MISTTLNWILEERPCVSGLNQLRNTLGHGYDPDTLISLRTILDSNGPLDALWCLRACDGAESYARAIVDWCIARAADKTYRDDVVQHSRTIERVEVMAFRIAFTLVHCADYAVYTETMSALGARMRELLAEREQAKWAGYAWLEENGYGAVRDIDL